MNIAQQGILEDETKLARYLTFSLKNEANIQSIFPVLHEMIDLSHTVIGFGPSLVTAANSRIPELKEMESQKTQTIDIPSTPTALWVWLRGDDRGKLYHRSRKLVNALSSHFVLIDTTDSFQYDRNRDLSGYEDGTENPEGTEAVAAAIVKNKGDGLDGSSFVAVQKWLHDFDAFDKMTIAAQDDAIGRHVSDNEEFEEAPESAHVKRSAQENFEPEAFMLRRSMPWAENMQAGLMFVAFGHSFDAFEAIMNRMIGLDDGIQDALFKFTKPIDGAYYWCPPVKDGKLDLSALNL